MPDWYYVDNITDNEAHHLVLLEDLRSEDPVLWALANHKMTSLSIARHINWPHTYTLNRLRALKHEGLVWDREGRRQVIWNLTEDSPHQELKLWVSQQWLEGGVFRRIDRNDE
jgi:hypothetical protein